MSHSTAFSPGILDSAFASAPASRSYPYRAASVRSETSDRTRPVPQPGSIMRAVLRSGSRP